MHWMDAVGNSGKVETRINESHDGTPFFNMAIFIERFSVPSWNRVLAMHHMSKNKLIGLTQCILDDTIQHRFDEHTELCLLEYDALCRPSEKKKNDLKLHKKVSKLKTKEGSKEPLITQRPKEFEGRVTIRFHHWRRRLIDIDNLCCKPLIDAIVRCGLLPDDGPSYIQQITQTQRKIVDLPNLVDEMVLVEIEEFTSFRTQLYLEIDEP